jgi:leucyl aminopeptidase
MNFHLYEQALSQWSGDCLIACCFADGSTAALPSALEPLDQAWGGVMAELIQEQSFAAKLGSAVSTRVGSDIKKVVLTGLGEAKSFSPDSLRQAVAVGLRQAHALKAKQVAILLPATEIDLAVVIQAATEGSLLVAHQDTRFKSQAKSNGASANGSQVNGGFSVELITLISATGASLAGYADSVTRSEQVAAGVLLARELVSAPANVVTPITLADTARQLAKDLGLEAEVLGYEDCMALGMGAFLGVAQASDLPPQFIHLTYRPAGGSPTAKVALVGKGLTFDSGGLNIKTDARSIAMMKTDMGGSAAVLGTAQVIGAMKPNVEVHFIVAATENMISGKAMHPGDILTASNHKTIEINNTDAEGRLTLADALVFAEKLEVDAILDLATLTGACVVALGEDIAGLFTPDADLAASILAAAKTTGEKIWQMPMEESYFEGLNSVVADMKNTGPRWGGAITASLFLKQFVEKTPWAHLDVAGPVWSDKDFGYINKGGTGYGVRILVEWVLSYTKS